LYQEGIGGAPIDSQNLVGWWPLNGNANDYSGNGNNGVIKGPLLFTSVAEFFAKVRSGTGKVLEGDLVNFASTYGSFSTQQSNFTNSNGTATAFLNQQATNGEALVKATAFNGNSTIAANIIDWWPMNLGSGNIAYSSNPLGNGFIENAYWNKPDYVSKFNGNSYINLPQNSLNANSVLTAVAWFKTTSTGVVLWNGNEPQISSASCYSPIIYINPQGDLAGGDSSSTGTLAFNTNYFVADGKWHQVIINQTATQQVLFLDGVEIATASLTPQTCTPFNWTIGAGTTSSGISYFNGSIANVQIYTSSLNAPQVHQLFSEGIAGLPISSAGLVAWYPLDGNANDYSGSGNNGAVYGNINFVGTQASANQQGAGNYSSFLAGSFNPTGSTTTGAYINIPGIVPINYSTFSYFAWIKPTDAESYSRVLATSGGDSGAIEVSTGGSTQIMINGYNTGGWLSINSNFPLNTWNLVGATYNGSAYTVYLNGKEVWSKTVGKLLGSAATGNLQIGLTTAYGVSGNQFFGNIANVQVYRSALSPNQVSQIYSSGITGLPISAAGLVGWYPLEGNANDYSGNGNNGIPTNVIFNAQQASKPSLINSLNGYGVDFNGQNSYIYNATAAPLNLQPNFTIAAMVYLNSYAGSPVIYSEGIPANTLSFGVSANGNLYASAWNAKTTNNWVGFTSNLKVPLNTWTFVALRLQNGGIGTGAATLYTDSQNQTFTLQEENNSGAHYLGIGFNVGYLGGQGFQGLNGSIANVQIFNKALTNEQINELYRNAYPPYATSEASMGVLP
ncbi:MAG: LamG-like jellyroll fold domain-containing protein, partial [Candidatus Micrarchaeia archaeon]